MPAGGVMRPALAAAAALLCLATACAAEGPVAIHAVQGAGGSSPLAGERVRIRDVVVTATGARGFFVQQPDDAVDGDPRTSEGLYVYDDFPEDLQAGDVVGLTGTVTEFHGHTQLTDLDELRRSGQARLPRPVALDPVPADGDLEWAESMRVSVPEGVVASPTDEHGEVRIATDGRRPLRGAGSPALRYLPEMDPAGLGGRAPALAAGRRFAAQGVLVYRFGDYVLWPTALRLGAAPPLPRPVRGAVEGELAVASYNLQLLYDDQGTGDEPVVGRDTYDRRIAKHAAWLREVLRCPDVVAVQEVDADGALERLARASGCGYRPVSGARPSDLALGYLFAPGVQLASEVRQLGREFRMPGGAALFDRPPLLAVLRTDGGSVALVNVHLRSMRGLDTEPGVARKREAQARALNELLDDVLTGTSGRVLVLGDFNAFPVGDVGDEDRMDVLGLVARGRGGVELAPVWRRLEREERYSYIFRGHGQMLDHAFYSPGIEPWLAESAFARGNADAPHGLRDDAGTPLGASDHDPLVLFLRPGDGAGAR